MTADLDWCSDLYEQDFVLCCEQQAALLRTGDFSKLDRVNLIDEIESLGKRDRRELRARLQELMQHLLIWRYQDGQQSKDRVARILEEHFAICRILNDSPSLGRLLTDSEGMAELYICATNRVVIDTGLSVERFPDRCPFCWEGLFEGGDLRGGFDVERYWVEGLVTE